MKNSLTSLNINGSTKINAVIGNPIKHTMSPGMHNKLYSGCNDLNFIYISFHLEEDELKSFFDIVKTKSFRGVNITVPFKEKVFPYLDKVDLKASNIGAVNTIVNNNGVLTGYNTDGDGFVFSIREENNYSLKGKTVAILGAGGSAKSIAFSLLEHKIEKLIILNRTEKKSQDLKQNLNNHYKTDIEVGNLESYEKLIDSNLIINTTSIGMDPYIDRSPVKNFEWVSKNHFIYDIIYNPSKTILLKECLKRGAKIQNGKGMLAAQGMLAHKLFTNNEGSYKLMKSQIV
ncbi:shikimate dehydrogenase [Candidatus Marinamargulisbacteria bacterium SCGC AG-410-N11]|nr:shikimate dehydrogenase [Candidatus Marinamargulisbacteria bacterium SCGC AG-410-N11]